MDTRNIDTATQICAFIKIKRANVWNELIRFLIQRMTSLIKLLLFYYFCSNIVFRRRRYCLLCFLDTVNDSKELIGKFRIDPVIFRHVAVYPVNLVLAFIYKLMQTEKSWAESCFLREVALVSCEISHQLELVRLGLSCSLFEWLDCLSFLANLIVCLCETILNCIVFFANFLVLLFRARLLLWIFWRRGRFSLVGRIRSLLINDLRFLIRCHLLLFLLLNSHIAMRCSSCHWDWKLYSLIVFLKGCRRIIWSITILS